MADNGLGPSAVALLIGADHTAVIRYRDEVRIPRPEIMAKIAEVTGGKVMPNDFFPNLPTAKCPDPECPKPGRERRATDRRNK